MRPARSRSTARPTSSALPGSRLAVGSSRITSEASRTNARARAIRWSSPAESGRPPSPTTVSYPSGSPATNSSAPASSAAARTPRRPPWRRPSRMLSATVPRKIVGCCGTQAIWARQAAESHAARSIVPAVTRPRVGSKRAKQERRDRALASSARADEGHRLSGRELEVDPVEHGALACGVGERDPFEPHGHVARARGRGGAGAPDASAALDEVEEPLGNGEAVCARVKLSGQVS